jgi:arylformamidase
VEDQAEARFIDLSHVIEHGMTTFKGLPAPHICDYWTREASADRYDSGETFQIGRIDMVANTGTYVDSPFHRYDNGKDLSELPLESLAALDGLLVRAPYDKGLAVDADAFAGLDVRGKAVLVATGWDRHWRTEAYYENHPYLTGEAAQWLAENGAAFVGIDSHNIDNTVLRSRPVHSTLLGAEIPIGEHLCNLTSLPDSGFRFSAVPPKVKGMGTFPVRAYALI